MKLSPEQIRAAGFIVSRKKGILNMECGMGKSLAALYAAHLTPAKHVIIIAPPSLEQKWMSEVRKLNHFIPHPWECKVEFRSYFNLKPFKKTPDFLIMDECHKFLKNWNKKNKGVFMRLALKTPYVCMLTATSMLNRPSEIYWMLRICGAYDGTLEKFKFRYAKGQRLRDHPTVVVETGFTHQKELYGMFDSVTFTAKRKLNTKKVHVDLGEMPFDYEKLDFTDLARFDSILATLKSKSKVIRGCLNKIYEKHKKVVVFFFNSCLNEEMNKNGESIDGSTPMKKRYQIIEKFKQSEKSVLFLNMMSCGVGLDIEGADAVVFLQHPWSPGAMHQNYMRCYRFLREKELRIYILTYQQELRTLTAEFNKKPTVEFSAVMNP